MEQKTLKALEFDKIKELLKNETSNDYSRRMAEELTPLCALCDVDKLLTELSEAMDVYIKRGNPHTAGAKDIGASLMRCEKGGTLSAAELLEVARVLKTARLLIAYYKEKKDKPLTIDYYFSSLFEDKKTEEAILGAIISEEEIADDASPKLLGIRRRIENTHAKIREHLNSIIHSTRYQKYLQESIVTVRDGRYVVPVKAEHSRDVAGIVHDMSSTGATLFIEPNAVVQENNTLRELELQEKAEIERILAELSAAVSQITNELAVNQKMIGEIDFLFAKARLGINMNAVIPQLNDGGMLRIIKGRHPLLNPKTAVPITVHLGDGIKTLVITGPNTGGKTVSLKTIGLLSLMAAAGLAVPAGDGTQLCVFDNVFADIGDEQSIEQSLSTFSSHMTNIVNIINNLTPNCLVLFDELGAGTDPTEGAALAIAILKHVKERGAATVATTHYSEIKLYALSAQGVENASCEFDINSLRPTYKLLTGVPGKSNAFAISKRLGLPEFIIESASEHLTEENIRFEDIISSLEKNRLQAEEERTRASRYRNEIEKLKTELEAEKKKLELSKGKMIEKANQQARKIVEDAKKESEDLIREIRNARRAKEQKELNAVINEARHKFNQKIKETHTVIAPDNNKSMPAPKEILPGSSVYLSDIQQNGTVLAPPKSDGTVTVQVGILKINSHISNLRLVQQEKQITAPDRQSGSMLRAGGIKSEIDLRGQTLDDAILLAEKFLDDAFLASVGTVTIIHGKGTGVLRKGIHDMLKRYPHVKSFRLGTFGEGESGVTVVELKS